MTIARIPKRPANDIQMEDAFIAGRQATPATASSERTKKMNKTSIMLRIDPDLLKAISREAEEAGLSRSAWIHSTLTKAARNKE